MNDIQKMLKDMVVVFVSSIDKLDEQIIDDKVKEVAGLPTFISLTQEDIEEVDKTIKEEFSIQLDEGSLIEEKKHEKWFLAKKSEFAMKYWERYRTYLLRDKGFSTNVVNKMDDILDKLTDLLGDPSRDVAYGRRGLIIGDVQSGKTANYIGLICKAVDSGYKVVVLLTGMIEKLRQQTQQRIDEGFVGADSDAMMKMQESKLQIGAGKYDSSVRPMVLTSMTDDFKQQNANNLGFDLRNIKGPVIFVVKKNSAVLRRLNKWLGTNRTGDNPINQSLLVIDDEADYASVNTKSEDSPTAINGRIREMLKMFSKSSYVGFTATPFANIFIDPESYNDMVAEDLFPKDYIYSLNAPSNYTGARDVFKEDGKARFMLRQINDDVKDHHSIAYLLPWGHKKTRWVNELPRDLEDAIAAFMLANVLEDLRGMTKSHRSMLVNVSRYTSVQERVSELVNDYLKNMQNACKLYCLLEPEMALQNEYIQRLKMVYEDVYSNEDVEWEAIQKSLHHSCAGIIVQTINQRNGQNLSFDDYKEGLRLIAVGGMSLSRGLTLEGLVISYFYRNSKMYDTLMQMGRWFGYRNKYEDLCRIWMSGDSIEWYRYISNATDELRDEVKRYEDTGLTPKDFGLRVRSDLTSLIVTARNKMKNTSQRVCTISLSGVSIETPELYSNLEKNTRNKDAVYSLFHELIDSGYHLIDGGRRSAVKWGFKNIPQRFVIDLLEKIEISPKNEQFDTNALVKFLRKYRGKELKNWDIAFASGKSGLMVKLGDKAFNPPIRQYSIENDGKILKMSGSKRRLGTVADGQFGLGDSQIDEIKSKKQHISQKDYFINVDRNPLLTVYFIDLGKYVGKETEENIEVRDRCSNEMYVGFGIGIPSLSDEETKYAKYVLNKVAMQQMFDGGIDGWDFDEDDDDID